MSENHLQPQQQDVCEEKVTNPRTPIPAAWPHLTDKDLDAIDFCQDMMDEKLQEIKKEGKYTNQDLCDLLSPLIANANTISKIGTTTDKTTPLALTILRT